MGIICLIILLLRKITALLRQRKVSFGWNLFLTLPADVALAAVLMGGLSFAAIRGGWFSGKTDETYIYLQEEWDVSPTDLPLTVSDLTGEEYSHIRRSAYDQGSLLVARHSCQERVREGYGRFFLEYEITRPRPWLYGLLLEDTLSPEERFIRFRSTRFSWNYTWEAVPAAPWGTETAYRRLIDGEPQNTWLLVFPDHLAELSLNWDLTPEQMGLVGEKLKNT